MVSGAPGAPREPRALRAECWRGPGSAEFLFCELNGAPLSPDFFSRSRWIFFEPSLGACSQASSVAMHSGLRTDNVRNVFAWEVTNLGKFTAAFLSLNRQSSSFNDAFRVEKAKLVMYLVRFTWRVIGEKNLCDAWSAWCLIVTSPSPPSE